ncbi:hypothetical protein FJZ53_03220 [Candidatus Woesearchaeota archaeon]|nr:hypothetical protein [Candidatus Woesearchaeota archaeon]
MALDDVITSLMEGNLEQLLIYLPIAIIVVGALVMLLIYLKDNWGVIFDRFSKLKTRAIQTRPKKSGEPQEVRKIDYEQEVDEVLKEQEPMKAMGGLSVLINQYFAQLLGLHGMFTHDELIDELEKKNKVNLKSFCEKLLELEYSKDEITKKELETIANEFLSIVKKHSPKSSITHPREFVKESKLFEGLKRFKSELLRDLEKKTTLEDKLGKVIDKTFQEIWGFIKEHFTPVNVPKKVSFNVVLEDVGAKKKQKVLKNILSEERPTVESFFYFIYLAFRRRIRENKRVNNINRMLSQGKDALSKKKRDVLKAQQIYSSIIPVYNALSEKGKDKMLPKIVLFYEDINNAVNFQKAMMQLLQLKLALRSNEQKQAMQYYLEVSKIYEQLPQQYRNEIYEQFLSLEKELKIGAAKK